MLRIGLTGGLGSGKSTVAEMLRESGVPIVEADAVAHEMIRRGGPAYAEIVSIFGTGILLPGGEIDRKKLADAAFLSQEKLARLDGIVHPHVLERIGRWLGEREREGAAVAVVEAPLLVETGYHRRLDRLVVVWCRPEQQAERLRLRGMSQEDAERRAAVQMPLEEKKRLADDTIDNSGALDETRRQVARLVGEWKQVAKESRQAAKED